MPNGIQRKLRQAWTFVFGSKPSPMRKPIWMCVRFLDGPLAGETRKIEPCLKYVAEMRYERWGIVATEYVWDTMYPDAEVNYMRLSEPSIQSGYAVLSI